MKKAVLFGCNYASDPRAKLRGCINDVNNMGSFLKSHNYDVRIFTDDTNAGIDTSANGIIGHLNTLASESWRNSLTHVWIHFSGHGCQRRDWSGDEKDGKDECIVPSDYKRSGLITDDTLKKVLVSFNPSTRLFLVFDCCHSGTICDLKYSYKVGDVNTETFEHFNQLRSPAVLISGCMDTQTSADAYNVSHRHQFTGAMTSCLLQVLTSSTDLTEYRLFDLLNDLQNILKGKGFSQKPQLSSSIPIENITKLLF